MAAGGAVSTAAAFPAPRPGLSPVQARLLVLTPSAGHEESSGGQSLKTRVMEEGARPIGIPLVAATAVALLGRAMEPPRARTWPIVLSQQHPPDMIHGAPRLCLLTHSPGHLCYDALVHEHGTPRCSTAAPGAELSGAETTHPEALLSHVVTSYDHACVIPQTPSSLGALHCPPHLFRRQGGVYMAHTQVR